MAGRDRSGGSEIPARRSILSGRAGALGAAGVYFLTGFLMSAARFAGTAAPFGAAAVAQAGAGLNGVASLAGACLGYLAVGGLTWGIRYAAACVLIFTAGFIFIDSKVRGRVWFMPALTASVMAATGLLGGLAAGDEPLELILPAVVEAVLSAGAVCFFREALSMGERSTEASEKRHDAAVIVFAACALMALSRLNIMGVISVGRALALVLVMTCALKGGSLAGAAAGTAFGLAMDAAAGGVPVFTMAYAFAGLVSGMFSRFGRLSFVLSFILANALAVFCVWSFTQRLDALFEVFAASVGFMLLPPGLLARIGSLIQPLSAGMGESGLRKYASRRVEGIARAFDDVSAVARRNTEFINDNDVARVFDRAADAACIRCKRRDECWVKNYMETLDALNQATAAMNERGLLEAEDIPEWFREKCKGLAAFVTAVNAELRASAGRRQFRARVEESRSAAWGQYEDFAEILAGVAQELGSLNGADPLAERRLMRYLRSQDIEADAAVFRDSTGRLRAVIESGKLSALTGDPAYLDKLSAVLGVRLCRPNSGGEGRLTLLEAEPLAVSVGIAAMKKKGEKVSGDHGTYFKTDAGVLCVILSDGMGTGEGAAVESTEAIEILERFLRSGVDPATAMKILNSVMLLRNGDEWGYATVDLMCVDLFTGETSFYKYGAAPSYVRTGKSVRRVSGESLAAGLVAGEGTAPDVVRMRLKPGSLAVIASDGVISGDDDAWLRELMREDRPETDMKTLARQVLRQAAEEYGTSDDMTVLAVRVDARV